MTRPTEMEASAEVSKQKVVEMEKMAQQGYGENATLPAPEYKVASFGFTGAPKSAKGIKPQGLGPDDIEMSPGVHFVGAIDWEIRDFHGYETRHGSSYNAYLVIDEYPTLIDTVKYPFASTLLDNISSIMPLKDLKYLVLNHAEPDHSSSAPHVCAAIPDIEVVCTNACKIAMEELYETSSWNWKIIEPMGELSLGRRSLTFVPVPNVHWPDSTWTWCPEDCILFANDGFGQHVATTRMWDDYHSLDYLLQLSRDYYANILMPCDGAIRKVLDLVLPLNLPIKKILTAHGVSWRTYIPDILNAYIQWAHQKVSAKVCIVYDTMYQATRLMANSYADGVRSTGVEFRMINMAKTHITDLASEVLDAAAIVVGSPNLNDTMMPTIHQACGYIGGLYPKLRLGGAFGSFGWNKASLLKSFQDVQKELHLEFVHEPVTSHFTPESEDLKECWRAGREMGFKVLQKVADQTSGKENIRKISTQVSTLVSEGEGRRLYVLYGSMSGTAKLAAEALRTALRQVTNVSVSFGAINSMNVESLRTIAAESKDAVEEMKPIVFFVTATTGDGDFPDNALSLWDELRASTEDLTGLSFCVFGLGSKSFAHFNGAAKQLHARLLELKATSVADLGLGDAMAPGGYRAAFDTWMIDATKHNNCYVELPPKPAFNVQIIQRPRVRVQTEGDLPDTQFGSPGAGTVPTGFTWVKFVKNERRTPEDYSRPVHFLELDLTGTNLTYSVGDHVAILPQNLPEHVDSLLEMYNLCRNMPLTVSVIPEHGPESTTVPERTTAFELFQQHFDLNSAPTRGFLINLKHYLTAEEDRVLLGSILKTPESLQAFSSEYTVLDVLKHFPSLQLPLDILLTVLPPMRPRWYSVASSPRRHPNRIHLLAVLNVWLSPKGVTKKGMTTSFLFRQQVSENSPVNLAVRIQKGILFPPDDPMTPAIMFGLGTGSAAIRSLLEDRLGIKEAGGQVGPCLVCCACRHAAKDFVLKCDLDLYRKAGAITDMQTAFSHDQEHFITIPDVIHQEPHHVWNVIKDPKTELFYCGVSFGVPEKCLAAVQEAIKRESGLTGDELTAFCDAITAEDRYHVESF
eukprot:GCRY01000505.1.p1 GENE.GCRY01000505.1~~GCRY01000505.1.p1  ORF type:complete len:1084 (+),score=283.37 GCRY01000505.1:1926-5177(+)